MAELVGRIALITGASRGIGAAAALSLAKSGADIALNHLNDKQAADEIASAVTALGRKAIAFDCDVSNFENVAQMVTEVQQSFGGLDILINNAGITADSPVWKMSEEQWDKVLDVNLKGCFNTIRAVSPILRDNKEKKYGRIVNVSSINGLRGKFGLANYAASKAGIIGLTNSVARELGKYQVTVNAVAPGFILTDLMSSLPEEIKAAALNETALKKLGEPADIASAISFLCSDGARHITGSVIKVDGGQYM